MNPAAAPSAIENADRRLAIATAAAVGTAGVVAGAVPFVASLTPSERARAGGAPIEVDLSTFAPGEMRTYEWRGKPVWVLRRTPEMIASLEKENTADLADPDSQRTTYPLPPYARNAMRSIKPEYFIALGICTHLGCTPVGPLAAGTAPALGEEPGFFCPCHGSTFDLAGRVFKNKPAPDNLEVPPHRYLSDTLVRIGDDTTA